MGDLGILIIGVVDTFFAFFVVAPMMLQAASLFGVQKQFAKAMVQEGVVKQEAVDRIHPKKQIAGVVISLLLLAVLAYTCTKSEPWGYICGGVGLVAGMLKYRALVQYNSETVKRFKNTGRDGPASLAADPVCMAMASSFYSEEAYSSASSSPQQDGVVRSRSSGRT